MSSVDLGALRIDGEAPLPKRPFAQRLTPWLLAIAGLGVLATFVLPLLRTVRTVPMATVTPVGATATAHASVAEAAGWIEPDPFHVLVRPLVDGRVESIDVLEGMPVRKDETVVARLASTSLQAAHERAQALVAERVQELAQAEAQSHAADAQLQQRGALRQALLDAERALAERRARLAAVTGAAERARAEATAAQAAWSAQQTLQASGGTYTVALARAAAASAAAEASAKASAAEREAIEQEVVAAAAARAFAEQRLDSPVELQGAADFAKAGVARAVAALATARTEAAIAARQLDACTVRAPSDGIVLRLQATPGSEVGPQRDAVLALYDPARLRARIDVPLALAGAIREGQAVELRSELLGTTIVRGTVQRLQRESDLLKNTLQAKVALHEPPALLRPETLCRARFLADAQQAAATTAMTFAVPKAAVQGTAVMRFDPTTGRVHAVPITVVGERGGDVLVQGELAPSQRVVLVAVADGEAVQEATP